MIAAPAPRTVEINDGRPPRKVRNPKHVFVGMIIEDNQVKENTLFWEQVGLLEASGATPDGFTFQRSRVSGSGLVKARNMATHMALKSDAGLFVFIDSDVVPTISSLARLVQGMSPEVRALSGMYPKKRSDKLEWVGNFSGSRPRPDGLIDSLDFGGGFCCLDLTMVEDLIELVHAETWYVCEDDPFRGEIVHDLWSNGRVIDDWKGKTFPRFLSEDFYMCWRIRRQLGLSLWMDTRNTVGHVGMIDFLQVHGLMKELENMSIFRAPPSA